MTTPQIDLASLPELDVAPGVCGSFASQPGISTDDRGIAIMVYLYENMATGA